MNSNCNWTRLFSGRFPFADKRKRTRTSGLLELIDRSVVVVVVWPGVVVIIIRICLPRLSPCSVAGRVLDGRLQAR